jgi:alkylation response protein AidB-like acyl-CoA dehydrogenase
MLSVEEREDLRASVAQLLDRMSTPAAVRGVVDTAPGFDQSLWDQFVALGWTGGHVPEGFGGAGAGPSSMAVVLHELGRHITPSPFLATAVVATGALLAAPNPALAGELVPLLVAGQRRATFAGADTSGSYDVSRRAFRLSGSSGFVLDADAADSIMVAAADDSGQPAVFAVSADLPGLGLERVPTVDHTRRLFTVRFQDVTVPPGSLLADPGPASAAVIQRAVALGAIAVACDAVGAAERITELTADYAKSRHQFGKPIGSFQAVKHHCADMVILLEGSRAAVRAAFKALDDPAGDWLLAAHVAASYAGPACAAVCELGIGVHGGIGFTWEHDAHLFLKRAKLDEMLFGTPRWHRRQLAGSLFPRISPGWGAGPGTHVE